MVGAIPSTLHQKVKFMVKEQLINVATKEDIVVTLTIPNPYIEVDENAIECSFNLWKWLMLHSSKKVRKF